MKKALKQRVCTIAQNVKKKMFSEISGGKVSEVPSPHPLELRPRINQRLFSFRSRIRSFGYHVYAATYPGVTR